MPNPEMLKLSKESKDAQRKAAVSSCVATEVKNGHSQDQAVAMCMSMMRKQTGQPEPAPEGGA